MAKKILFADEGRRKLQRGVDILANAIKVTLGPKGKVVIFRRGDPIFSLDGVTVAKVIELPLAEGTYEIFIASGGTPASEPISFTVAGQNREFIFAWKEK